MSKITIVGKGTAGCLAAAHFHGYTNWNIEWVYDPETKPWSVGEGTTLTIPKTLFDTLGYRANDLYEVDGTPKLGIWKENWGVGNKYLHPFPIGEQGIHINASKLQEKIFNDISDSSRVTITEKKVSSTDDLDAYKVMMCAGHPKEFGEEYIKRTGIPVNSVYVTQCYWDNPKFLYSLTNAMRYGWIFGIPLQNRVAIGYLYNNEINTLEEVKEDIKNVFEQYDLIPSEDTNSFSFNNYSRLRTTAERGRVFYNGTASFFLEPLEATSLANADRINRFAYDFWEKNKTLIQTDLAYDREIDATENMIALHYLSGSVFDTEFWKFAKENAEQHFKGNQLYRQVMDKVVNNYSDNSSIGTWGDYSYKMNLKNLGLWDKIKGEFGAKQLI